METLLWPIGLILLGLVILACEAFIPSAGVLGLLSAVSILAGIAMAFYSGGIATGTAFFGVAIVAVMCTVTALIQWWPKTPLGRLILIDPRDADDQVPDLSSLQLLLGQVGQTRSLMLPGGMVEIEGKTYDAVTDGASIEKGTWVEVTAVRGRNLIVRPIDEELIRQHQSTLASTPDTLSRPVGDDVPDPFIDPLA